MISPILGSSSLSRRGRSDQTGSHEAIGSSSSSRRPSNSSSSRKASNASYIDDWSGGFTGIVDLDRRMRQLAMAEQGLSGHHTEEDNDVYEPYPSASASWLDQHTRGKSACEAPSSSISRSSLATGRSEPSLTSFNDASASLTTSATSRLSQDSRHYSSLLAKRNSSLTSTLGSCDEAPLPLKLAPLPTSPSAFGNMLLMEAPGPSTLPRRSGVLPSSPWSSCDEQDLLTPHVISNKRLEPITPGTAAAATWTDPSAPGYFPAGLGVESKKKSRSLRKKAARAPLPRLVSGEVVSSPVAESQHEHKPDAFLLVLSDTYSTDSAQDSSSSLSTPNSLRRSAQSLALSLRFKMLRAKRKVRNTGQGAAELFAATHGSRRTSAEGTLST